MTVVAPQIFLMNQATLKVATDNYEQSCNSAKLTPNTPIAKFKGIGGGTTKASGTPDWMLTLGFAQDWVTVKAFSQYCQDNAGTIKSIELTPQVGGKKATVNVLIVAGVFGGDVDQTQVDTVTFEVIGQPVFAASA